jgi:hypothetical protein
MSDSARLTGPDPEEVLADIETLLCLTQSSFIGANQKPKLDEIKKKYYPMMYERGW